MTIKLTATSCTIDGKEFHPQRDRKTITVMLNNALKQG